MRPRIVCVVGPTASGKTALALDLAAALDAEILSADSRQVYRGLDVGTAKPTPAERARIRHHGLDLVGPDEPFDVGRYRVAAEAMIADATARGRRLVVVGGTGLYVRALLHGLCAAPPRDPRLRRVLQGWIAREGAPALHRRLQALDPATAVRVHTHDAVRIVRGLEVPLLSGRRLSDWQATHGFDDRPVDALVIGLTMPTAALDARIGARARDMIAAGWLDEVRQLLACRYSDDAPVWRTLGYAEMRTVVEGRSTLDAALASTVLATRRFAKRQRTWFRRERDVVWHDAGDRARALHAAIAFFAARRVANAEGGE